MAGDWLHMRLDLPEDPAVIGIADRLGLDVLDVVGRLYAVWRWFDQQTTDGQMFNLTTVRLLSEIDQRARQSGFGKAMREEGWLEDHGIPKFDRWMSMSAKKRLRNSRDQAASRARRRVRETSSEKPDKNLTRVEKSRVEKSKENTYGAKRALLVARFEKFWESYPRREGKRGPKASALTKWLAITETDRLAAEKGLDLYAAACNGLPVDCVRYLRHRRWEDETDESAPRRGSTQDQVLAMMREDAELDRRLRCP